MQESGVPGIDIVTFSGVGAPAGTPRRSSTCSTATSTRSCSSRDVRAMFAAHGYEAVGGTADDFRRMLSADVDQWSRVIRAANVTFD